MAVKRSRYRQSIVDQPLTDFERKTGLSSNCSKEKGERHFVFSKFTQGHFDNIGQRVAVKYVGDCASDIEH